jgi:hypothetical protein
VRTWKRAESRGGTRAALLLRASLRSLHSPDTHTHQSRDAQTDVPSVGPAACRNALSSHAPFLCSAPPTHAPRTTHTPCALKDASGAEITSQLSPPAAAAAHG